MNTSVDETQTTIRRYQFPDLAIPPPISATQSDQPVSSETDRSMPPDGQWRLLYRTVQNARKKGYQTGYEKGLEDGRKDGYEKGETLGRQAGIDQINESMTREKDEILARVKALWEELEGLQGKTMEHLGDSLAELITTVVQTVLGHELTLSRVSLKKVIEESLGLLPRLTGLTIVCHPEDRPLIEQMSDQLPEQWTIREDESLMPGGCRLEASGGEVDASVPARMKLCLASVTDALL